MTTSHRCPGCGKQTSEKNMLLYFRNGTLQRMECKWCAKQGRRSLSETIRVGHTIKT